jgi:hypothetical protein
MLKGQEQPEQLASLEFGYGIQIGSGDFSKRYGQHNRLHISTLYHRSNWIMGPGIDYLFGAQVKEDVLAPFRTPEGDLIGIDHTLALVDLRMRGLALRLAIKKLIGSEKQKGGFIIGLAPGWQAHWIRFQNPANNFDAIREPYRWGYDRFSAGWGMLEEIGYRYQNSNKTVQFEIAFQASHTRSKLRRNLQLDKPNFDFPPQWDHLWGLTAKWILPIFARKNPDQIYY